MKLENIDQAEAWSTDTMLPVGWHDVAIEEAEEGLSTNGHPQMELRLVNESGSIRDWIVNVPATQGKIKQLLDAASISIESGEWEFSPTTLVGKRVRVHIGEEPRNDDPSTMRRRVKAYTALKAEGADDSDLPF